MAVVELGREFTPNGEGSSIAAAAHTHHAEIIEQERELRKEAESRVRHLEAVLDKLQATVISKDQEIAKLRREVTNRFASPVGAGGSSMHQSFLKAVPLFQSLGEDQLRSMGQFLSTVDFEDKEVIINEGEPGEAFFIIVRGKVNVTKQLEDGKMLLLKTLVTGDYFGERALLLDERRAATCTSEQQTRCLRLERQGFNHALSSVQNLLGEQVDSYNYAASELSVKGLTEYAKVFVDMLDDIPSGTLHHAELLQTANIAAVFRDAPISEPLSAVERTQVMMRMFDTFSPELNLDDTLSLLINMAGQLLDVEQVRVYWPVQVHKRQLSLYAVDDAFCSVSMKWNGVAAQVAASGVTNPVRINLEQLGQQQEGAHGKRASGGAGSSPRSRANAQADRISRCSSRDVVAAAILNEAADEGQNVCGILELVNSKRPMGFTMKDLEVAQLLAMEVSGLMAQRREEFAYLGGRVSGFVSSAAATDRFSMLLSKISIAPATLEFWKEMLGMRQAVLQATLLHGQESLASTWKSPPAPVSRLSDVRPTRTGLHDDPSKKNNSSIMFQVNFQAWARFEIRTCDLPRATRILIELLTSEGRTFAFCVFPLFGHDNSIRYANSDVCLIYGAPVSEVRSPIVGTLEREIVLRVEIPGSAQPASAERSGSKPPELLFCDYDSLTNGLPNTVGIGELPLPVEVQDITRNHNLLQELKPHEKTLLWAHRDQLVRNPNNLSLLAMSTNWGSRASVLEMYRLLQRCPMTSPYKALYLLDSRFPDPKIRAYAVRCLDALSDYEVSQLMLQLVQVLKFEPSHDSSLCRFLLRRAILSPRIVGHSLYWMLFTEKNINDTNHHCRILLELFLNGCHDYRIEIGHQMYILKKLAAVCQAVIPINNGEQRDATLRHELSKLVLPSEFQLPLSAYMVCSGINIEKCRVMNSKKRPLWLNFQNAHDTMRSHVVLYKWGDDLRQDLLTLQVMRIMDGIWKSAGLDLKMNAYGCVATAQEEGMLEVVPHSNTLAGIVRDYCGRRGSIGKVAAAREALVGRQALMHWLRDKASKRSLDALRRMSESKSDGNLMRIGGDAATSFQVDMHNAKGAADEPEGDDPAEAPELRQVLDNFQDSCAGCCVSTFVLGIGDRHNDNIMLTEDGRLFHIDFGHFLGNFKSKWGVKREAAPFVFTKHFETVLGGRAKGSRFQKFSQLACKAYVELRRHGNLLLALFSLMVDCGIPELQRLSDVKWIQDALQVHLSEAEAIAWFQGLINRSLLCATTRWNHAIHLMAKG